MSLLSGCRYSGYEAPIDVNHHDSPFLSFSDDDDFPRDVRDDLAVLSAAIEEIRWRNPDADLVDVSRGGRSLALSRRGAGTPGAPPAPGIWIWPDWRDPSAVITIADHEFERFVSDRHVIVRRDRREMLVDLGSAERIHAVPDGRIDSMSNDGRYVAIDGHHRVILGTFAAERGFVKSETRVVLEFASEAALLHYGEFVAINLIGGGIVIMRFDEAPETIEIIQPTFPLHREDGYLTVEFDEPSRSRQSPAFGFPVETAFFAWIGNENYHVWMRPDGTLDLNRMDFWNWSNERAMHLSPSGCYVMTWNDGPAPGALFVRMHEVSGVDGPEPELPGASSGQLWLTWTDESGSQE